MASEEELIAARRRHIEKLQEAGAQAFPSGVRFDAGDDAKRREVIAIANDEVRRAQLPGEGEPEEEPSAGTGAGKDEEGGADKKGDGAGANPDGDL